MQLTFQKPETTIDALSFIIMKIYGERWDTIHVEIIATSSNAGTLLIALEEFYDSNSIVTYSYEHLLENDIPKESNLSFSTQIIDVNAFKFTGVSICCK